MTTSPHPEKAPRMTLWADTAVEMMMPNPISVRDTATVQEAIALLADRGFSAAPVIDDAGRPVGVLSQSDILIHTRARGSGALSEYYDEGGPDKTEHVPANAGRAEVADALVRDVMTPVVFSVMPDRPADKVVEEMLALKIHRLFVVDQAGALIGVISALDVLRKLRT